MRLYGTLCILFLALLLADCGKKVQPVSYREQIQPVLQAKCVSCHGGQGPAGKIVLSSYESLMASRTVKGKKPLVVSGSLPESWLYVLGGTDQPHFRMPPDTSRVTPLSREEVKLVGEWILQGAKNN